MTNSQMVENEINKIYYSWTYDLSETDSGHVTIHTFLPMDLDYIKKKLNEIGFLDFSFKYSRKVW
jgi:hypothetical protein